MTGVFFGAAVSPAADSMRLNLSSLVALPVLCGVVSSAVQAPEDESSVVKGPVQVTMLWRSERALLQYADQAADVAAAVTSAVVADRGGVLNTLHGESAAAPDTQGPGEVPAAPAVHVYLAESPAAVRKLLRGEKEPTRRGKRKRDVPTRPAPFKEGEEPKAPAEVPQRPSAELALIARGVEGLGGVVVGVAPKVDDRILFHTGITPSAIRRVAAESASVALGDFADVGHVEYFVAEGLSGTVWGGSYEDDPWISSGLVELQSKLRAVPEESRMGRLLELAAAAVSTPETWTPSSPDAASAEAAAALALVAGERRVLESNSVDGASAVGAALDWAMGLKPRWALESGASGHHPFGYHVVAGRRADALLMAADAAEGEHYRIETSFVAYSNNREAPLQADLVFGDQGGDRYLLACNSREGIYLFHRAGPDTPYEVVQEMKEVKIPVGAQIAVKVEVKDDVIIVEVGGVEIPRVVTQKRLARGQWGIGAHSGSSVLWSDPKLTTVR